jgi:competence protein ComEC
VRVGRRALELVRIQLWVTLILSVPLVLIFGWLSASAPLVNLVAIPLISLLVLPAGLAGLVLAAAGHAAGEAVLGVLGSLLVALTRMLDPLGVTLALAAPGLPWLLLAGLLLIRAAGTDPAPVRWLALVLGIALLGAPRTGPPEGEFRVRVLDVGQGSAVVVRTRNRVLVMDAGNRFGAPGIDAGALVVAPALRALGVRRIDRLLVSHGDADHAGGVPGLLAAMDVTEVLGPAGVPGRIGPCDRALAWSWDGVRFEVLHPPGGAALPGNRGSCVLRVRNARSAVLLPGDVDRYVERRLAATLGRIDLMVAPHHGSRTSSGRALVRHARARWVLFSAGRPNAFGHPHPDVVARWREAGACTAVTGDAGMLVWSSRTPDRVRGWRASRPRWWRGADFSVPALGRCRPEPVGGALPAAWARAPP